MLTSTDMEVNCDNMVISKSVQPTDKRISRIVKRYQKRNVETFCKIGMRKIYPHYCSKVKCVYAYCLI